MISEDYVMAAESSMFHHTNTLHFKTFILSCNNITMLVYFHIFEQINAAFGENKRLLSKTFKNLPTSIF